MRVSGIKLINKITLFTRPNCGLCETAKRTIQSLEHKYQVPFEYKEVDITKAENKQWKDIYDFDVPVAHVCKSGHSDFVKFMHRLEAEKVLDVLK
jgi:glutaredoxin